MNAGTDAQATEVAAVLYVGHRPLGSFVTFSALLKPTAQEGVRLAKYSACHFACALLPENGATELDMYDNCQSVYNVHVQVGCSA